MDCLLSLSFVRIFSFRVSLTSKAVSAVKSPRHHLLFVSRKRERDQPCPLANLFRFSESKWEGAMRSGVAMLWWHAYGRGWTTSGKIAPMAVRMAALCNRLCARLRPYQPHGVAVDEPEAACMPRVSSSQRRYWWCTRNYRFI